MIDVNQILNLLSIDPVYRTSKYSEFVKVYFRLDGGTYIIELIKSIEEWEKEWLEKKGINVYSDNILITNKNPLSLPIEAIGHKHPVFYLANIERVRKTVLIELCRNKGNVFVAKGAKLFDQAFNESVPADKNCKLLDAVKFASKLIMHDLCIIIHGFVYTDGSVRAMNVYIYPNNNKKQF